MQGFFRYPYKADTRLWAVRLLVYACLAIGFWGVGFVQFPPLTLFGNSIETNLTATVFSMSTGFILTLFAVYAAIVVTVSIGPAKEVVITRDAITAPKSAHNRRNFTLAFADITDQKLLMYSKKRRLYILHHKDGKFKVDEALCESDTSFDDIVARVENSIKHTKTMVTFPATDSRTVN